MLTDPIADMLTRIRNAIMIKADKVDVPASRMKLEIVKIMKEYGFIRGYKIIKDRRQGIIRISLKYVDGECVINGLERVSKPGRRVYVGVDELPNVKGGIGIAIVSTSKGLMSDKKCREQRIGGELLCYIW